MGMVQEVRQIWQSLVGAPAGAAVVSGLRITKYPIDAAGAVLTADGAGVGKWKFKAAGANVAVIVAAGVIAATTPFQLAWLGLDTPLHVAVYIPRIGIGTGAGVAMTAVLYEGFAELLVAGSYLMQTLPFCATAIAGATVNIVGDVAVSTAVNETINASVGVKTGLGT